MAQVQLPEVVKNARLDGRRLTVTLLDDVVVKLDVTSTGLNWVNSHP